MAKFPTYEEMAKNVAEKALDDFLYNGKSIREWMQIIASEDCISRAEALKEMQIYYDDCAKTSEYTRLGFETAMNVVESLPSIQPKTDVLDKIRAEIADLDDADYDYEGYYKAVTDALKIIDKYKAESENQ